MGKESVSRTWRTATAWRAAVSLPLTLVSLLASGAAVPLLAQNIFPSDPLTPPSALPSQSLPQALGTYRVFVAGSDPSTLDQVRQVIPDAFVDRRSSPAVIQVGRFAQQANASALRDQLQQQGIGAQIDTVSAVASDLSLPPAPSGSFSGPDLASAPPVIAQGPPSVGAGLNAPSLNPGSEIEISRFGAAGGYGAGSGYGAPGSLYSTNPPLSANLLPTEANYAASQAPGASPTSVSLPMLSPPRSAAPRSPNRYIAAVPTGSVETLSRVRRAYPNACFQSSRLGTFIQVADSDQRRDVELVKDYLRTQSVDARVLYFRQESSPPPITGAQLNYACPDAVIRRFG